MIKFPRADWEQV